MRNRSKLEQRLCDRLAVPKARKQFSLEARGRQGFIVSCLACAGAGIHKVGCPQRRILPGVSS